MLFDTKFLAALLAISGVNASKLIKSRAAASNLTLYAYGTNITGLNVFYADGLAWIGNAAPSGASVASNITFSTTDPNSNSATWSATSSDSAFSATPALYIVPTNNTFTQVGFYTSSNSSSLPTGGVTTGFELFGSSLSYITSDGTLEQQFWAEATDATDTWRLMWNAGGEGGVTVDGYAITPVTVKTTAPLVISDSTDSTSK